MEDNKPIDGAEYISLEDAKRLKLPYFEGLAAGYPSPAGDYQHESLDLNEKFVHHPEASYFVRVRGESMIGLGLFDDDICLTDRSEEITDGNIVVAFVNGGLTVKQIDLSTRDKGYMDLKTGIEHNIRWSALRWLGIDLGSNIFYTHSRADWHDTAIRNQGWTTNTSATLNIMPLRGMTVQAQYFVTTTQYFPQFTTKTIHYCNVGIRQQLPKTSLTLSALVTDVFYTRCWDISSDNPVYTLTNTSRNRSRVLWLGLTWNFHSYKPLGGTKKQEEDRSVIRLGE